MNKLWNLPTNKPKQWTNYDPYKLTRKSDEHVMKLTNEQAKASHDIPSVNKSHQWTSLSHEQVLTHTDESWTCHNTNQWTCHQQRTSHNYDQVMTMNKSQLLVCSSHHYEQVVTQNKS